MRGIFVAGIGAGLCGALLAGGSADAAFKGNRTIETDGTPILGEATWDPETFSHGDTATVFGQVSGGIGTEFIHDYTFTTTISLSGGSSAGSASVNTLTFQNFTIADLANVQYSLYEDGQTAGPFVDAPDTVTFANLDEGTTYVFRVIGEVASNAIGGIGNYSGNLYITPIPGAALLFGSALAGLVWVRRRKVSGDVLAVEVAA